MKCLLCVGFVVSAIFSFSQKNDTLLLVKEQTFNTNNELEAITSYEYDERNNVRTIVFKDLRDDFETKKVIEYDVKNQKRYEMNYKIDSSLSILTDSSFFHSNSRYYVSYLDNNQIIEEISKVDTNGIVFFKQTTRKQVNPKTTMIQNEGEPGFDFIVFSDFIDSTFFYNQRNLKVKKTYTAMACTVKEIQNGNLVNKIFPQNALVSIQYSYFEDDRIIQIQDFDADSILKNKQQFFYDSNGSLIEIRKSNLMTVPPKVFSSYYSKEIKDSISIEKNWSNEFEGFSLEKRLIKSPCLLVEKSFFISEKTISNSIIYKYEGEILKEIKEFDFSNANANVKSLDLDNKYPSRYTLLTYETRNKE